MMTLFEKVPESVVYVGFVIGCGFGAMILAFMVVAAIDGIREGIRKWKRIYQVKHRFDKPPTAKCYCIDCKRHSYDGECYKFKGWRTANDWFCWDAEPKDR